MYRALPLLGILALGLPAAATAQQSDRDVVMAQLDAVRDKTGENGFHVASSTLNGGTIVGQISNGGTVVLELGLNGGHQYMISAGCDHDCSDLDLRIYNANGGEKITEDVEDDDVPVIVFNSPGSGTYLLGVSMAKCSTNACWFGFRVFEK